MNPGWPHYAGQPGFSFASDVIPLPPVAALIPSTTAFASTDDDIAVIILPEGSTTGIPVYNLPTLACWASSTNRAGWPATGQSS